MSKLEGHKLITVQAVKEIKGSCSTHPLGGNLSGANLPAHVVNRDILDVIILGHWADFGQSHHFMRRFDGQSPYEAYVESVEWIRSNAFQTSKTLARRIRKYLHNNKPLGIICTR